MPSDVHEPFLIFKPVFMAGFGHVGKPGVLFLYPKRNECTKVSRPTLRNIAVFCQGGLNQGITIIAITYRQNYHILI